MTASSLGTWSISPQFRPKKTWSLQAAWVIPNMKFFNTKLYESTLTQFPVLYSRCCTMFLFLRCQKWPSWAFSFPLSPVFSSPRCSGVIQICTAHLSPGFQFHSLSSSAWRYQTSYVTQRWNHLLHDQLCFLLLFRCHQPRYDENSASWQARGIFYLNEAIHL